jgi:hypothetical protein
MKNIKVERTFRFEHFHEVRLAEHLSIDSRIVQYAESRQNTPHDQPICSHITNPNLKILATIGLQIGALNDITAAGR